MKKTIPLVAVFLGSVVICAVGARSHSASASVLWGVMEDPTTIEEFLVDIDPTTGVGTPIGSSFNIPSPASQTSAFDPSTGTLFFVSTFDAESEERLFSVDTATGSLISRRGSD